METTILICFLVYTLLLFVVMWITGRRGAKGNEAFFRAGRKSPWPVVAYGMIGASLSGVTFMSVPGDVLANKWFYMPMVLGYVLGYATIALVLLPLYYKLNLTSIYSYLGRRFGFLSEKTGALFFILSRLLGSALRMYLVVFVLYEFVFCSWGIPFWVPAVVFIAIILLYTFTGGIKTVVWTDTLQTTFLILAAIATVVAILGELDGMSLSELLRTSSEQGYTQMFNTDPMSPKFWVKQVLAGMFITITMTGLDQDMMQKNLTCKTLRDAQKNVITSSLLFIIVNIIFLCLGAALIAYANQTGFDLPTATTSQGATYVVGDKIFPSIAFHLGGFIAICFVLGIVAAGYSSADGTLTALTTTFCYDFLGFDKDGQKKVGVRRLVHVAFALVFLLIIIAFRPFHSDSLITIIFDVAGFTYGPLLGLFAFGLFTRRSVDDRWVPFIAVLSPVVCYILKLHSPAWLGYTFGFEILLLNGLITFLGLMAIPRKR